MVYKTYTEFRNAGMLTLVNTILHIFGWAIVYCKDSDGVESFRPARVLFRGFPEESMSTMYQRISAWMKGHAEELDDEANS